MFVVDYLIFNADDLIVFLMYPIPALRFGGCAAFGRRPARAPAAPRDSSLRFSVSRSLSSCPRCQNRTVFRRSILYILFFLLQFLSKGKMIFGGFKGMLGLGLGLGDVMVIIRVRNPFLRLGLERIRQ